MFDQNAVIGAVVSMVERNPNMQQMIKNDPSKAAMYEALRTGNAQRGQELANNFCNSCGESRESMISRGTEFLMSGFRR